MPVTNWTTTFIDGKPFLVIDVAKFRIPLEWDPSSNMFIAVAAPDGGLGNFPALVKGDKGDSVDLDTVVNYDFLEYGDATPDSASLTEISPDLFQLNLVLHRGATGAAGVMVLDAADYGTPVEGSMIVLASDLETFEYQAQKVGDTYWPAAIAEVPTGNPAYTLCPIIVEPQPWDWRPHVQGQTVILGTGADVRVNLVARIERPSTINGETAGPFAAKGFGPIGVNSAGVATVFSSGPLTGSSATYNKILAGEEATIWIRTERVTGAQTYSTDSDTSTFSVKVDPVP